MGAVPNYLSTNTSNQQLQFNEQTQTKAGFNAAIADLDSPFILRRVTAIDNLQTIMDSSPSYQPTIVNVLCQFIREHAQIGNAFSGDSDKYAPPSSPTQTDIQAALKVVGTRDASHDSPALVVNLSNANLAGADLSGLNLNHAILYNTKLAYALLVQADLQGATITKTDMEHSNLTRADLRNANLDTVNLSWSCLPSANLSSTHVDASFFHAILERAVLLDMISSGPDFIGADLRGADLRGAELRGADLTNANLRDADLPKTGLNSPSTPIAPVYYAPCGPRG